MIKNHKIALKSAGPCKISQRKPDPGLVELFKSIYKCFLAFLDKARDEKIVTGCIKNDI